MSYTAHTQALKDQGALVVRLRQRLGTCSMRDYRDCETAFNEAHNKLLALQEMPVPAKRVTRRQWLD